MPFAKVPWIDGPQVIIEDRGEGTNACTTRDQDEVYCYTNDSGKKGDPRNWYDLPPTGPKWNYA